MGDEIPRLKYDLSNEVEVEANITPQQPQIPDDTTTSVFQVGTSPWMRGAVIQSHNTNSNTPPSSPPPHGPLLDANGPHPAALSNIITQEEKEKDKAKREQELQKEQIRQKVITELEQRDLRICRNYFIVGCFGLPFLLWINVVYFSGQLRASAGNFRVRKYVWLSLIVALIETFLWILWFVVFQLLRDSTLSALDITHSNFTIGLLA